MYSDPSPTEIFQGDVIDHFVFSSIDQSKGLDLDKDAPIPETFSIKPNLSHGQSIIVTQTCDISRRKFILLAPIFGIQSLIDTLRSSGKKEENINSEISQLKNQKLFYYFYVPGDAARGVKEGYADLTFLNPLEREQMGILTRLASLDDFQRHHLAYKLGNLFMRPH